MRLQSSLGKAVNNSRGDLDNRGKLSLAKVVKSNNRDSTADVIMLNGTFVGQGSGTDDSISCLRLSNYSGYNIDSGSSYGSVTPLRKGDIVVVAYLESDKHRPIIIGSLANHDYSLTNSPELKADGEYEADIDESFSVNHLQDYSYSNGLGEFEKVHHSGAFFVGKREKMSDHRENAFEIEDLSIKDKWNYKTIKNKEEFNPFNYLLVTRNKEDSNDEEVMFSRFYHDAELGVTRFSRDTINQLFFMELNDGFRIQFNKNSNRRFRDSKEQEIYDHKTLRKSDHDFLYPKLPREDIPEFQKIESFSRFEIKDNGDLSIKVQDGGEQTEISIGSSEVSLLSTKPINIQSKSSINIVAPIVTISETTPNFEIEEVDEENEWKCEWVDPTKAYGDGV